MRFSARANLYIYVHVDIPITRSELQRLVDKATGNVEPWRNTRGHALENYVVVDRTSDGRVVGQPFTFNLVQISTHGRNSSVTLGLQQLFAYRTFIESIANALLDLNVPGVHSVQGFVDYSLPITSQSTAPLA